MSHQLISNVYKSKIGIFVIQVVLLTVFIWIFNYSIPINFDPGILYEREVIIQFIGNYVIADTFMHGLLLFVVWFIVSLFPVVIYRESKRAMFANLKLMFFPNFFFYLFYHRYSPTFFSSTWGRFLLPFLLLGGCILMISVLFPTIYHKLTATKPEVKREELRKLAQKSRSRCPKCGAEFDSKPTFCYKCSTRLIPEGSEDPKDIN